MNISFIGLGKMGRPMARNCRGGLGTGLMLEDLGLATEAAGPAGQCVALGAVAERLCRSWSSRGAGAQGLSSIINLVERRAWRATGDVHD